MRAWASCASSEQPKYPPSALRIARELLQWPLPMSTGSPEQRVFLTMEALDSGLFGSWQPCTKGQP